MFWPIFPVAFGSTMSNASAIKFKSRPCDECNDEQHSDEHNDNESHDQTGEKNSQPCLAKNAAAKF
jgi:uncharacterized Zn-finger protein